MTDIAAVAKGQLVLPIYPLPHRAHERQPVRAYLTEQSKP